NEQKRIVKRCRITIITDRGRTSARLRLAPQQARRAQGVWQTSLDLSRRSAARHPECTWIARRSTSDAIEKAFSLRPLHGNPSSLAGWEPDQGSSYLSEPRGLAVPSPWPKP